MAKQESLLSKTGKSVEEGLIPPEQAEALRPREGEAVPAMPARRVKADEILVCRDNLAVFLAMAFLMGLNWGALGSAGREFSVLGPTAAMLVLGWWLRGSESARLRQGAQALWLAACLMSVLFFAVTFYELGLIDLSRRGLDPLVVVSCLLATGAAAAAFALLPSIAQSIAFHLCGSAVLFTFFSWLDWRLRLVSHFHKTLGLLAIGLIAGGLWLALSEWLRAKGKQGLVTVSQVFGALTVLYFTFVSAASIYPATWQKTLLEVVAFVASIAFIAASLKRQSQVFLYSGAAFLFLLIIYVNFEHFADRIGMPIALLISGALLIGLGLGTGRLSRRIRAQNGAADVPPFHQSGSDSARRRRDRRMG